MCNNKLYKISLKNHLEKTKIILLFPLSFCNDKTYFMQVIDDQVSCVQVSAETDLLLYYHV